MNTGRKMEAQEYGEIIIGCAGLCVSHAFSDRTLSIHFAYIHMMTQLTLHNFRCMPLENNYCILICFPSRISIHLLCDARAVGREMCAMEEGEGMKTANQKKIFAKFICSQWNKCRVVNNSYIFVFVSHFLSCDVYAKQTNLQCTSNILRTKEKTPFDVSNTHTSLTHTHIYNIYRKNIKKKCLEINGYGNSWRNSTLQF